MKFQYKINEENPFLFSAVADLTFASTNKIKTVVAELFLAGALNDKNWNTLCTSRQIYLPSRCQNPRKNVEVWIPRRKTIELRKKEETKSRNNSFPANVGRLRRDYSANCSSEINNWLFLSSGLPSVFVTEPWRELLGQVMDKFVTTGCSLINVSDCMPAIMSTIGIE